jgi:predicted ATP-dependent endonuclease of OLD family
MITDIKITHNNTFKNLVIPKLNQLNIFIGSNNSGKSYLLRTLFEYDFIFMINLFDSSELENLLEKLSTAIEVIRIANSPSATVSNICAMINNLRRSKFISQVSNIDTLTKMIDQIHDSMKGNNINSENGIDVKRCFLDISNTLQRHESNINQIVSKFNPIDSTFSKNFIPILRGLIPLQITDGKFDETFNNYTQRVQLDYFKNENLVIHTGLNLYKEIRSNLLGENINREKVKKFEEFLSNSFYDGKHVTLIPRDATDVLYIQIGKEERPIYEVGDGIQTIILITYPIFFAELGNNLFFIEEPETHLHAGLQRLLIETLLKPEFSNNQYFITSHSNHFLDLTLDYDNISIYSVTKHEDKPDIKFNIENLNENATEVLGLLGIRNSSVFLSNCTIWVEGITDRLYLRKMLEIFAINKFKEDFNYSFIEYSGNNITHWSFLEDADPKHTNIKYDSITKKIFLIADSDGVEEGNDASEIGNLNENTPKKKKNKTAKAKRHAKLKKYLGDNFFLIKGYEIENMLSVSILQQTIQTMYSKYSEKLLDFENKYSAKEKVFEQIQNLEKEIKTFDKLKFCKIALQLINKKSDFTEDAYKLITRLNAFLQESNK